MTDLPLYNCHKQVRAARISKIEGFSDGDAYLQFNWEGQEGINAVHVSREYMRKHEPKWGGYYIRYKDGYESYSPAEAFEEGYSLDEGLTLHFAAEAEEAESRAPRVTLGDIVDYVRKQAAKNIPVNRACMESHSFVPVAGRDSFYFCTCCGDTRTIE